MKNQSADSELQALRLPPHSVEAEQAVIGGLLLDNAAYDRIASLVHSDDFYRYDHRLIFEHIVRLIDETKPADVVTVFNSMNAVSKAEEVGGLVYLNELTSNTPSAANIVQYAQIVRDRSILRQLITISEEITASAFATKGREVRQILDEAEQKIFAIAEEGARGKQDFQAIKSLLGNVVERIEYLNNEANGDDVTGVPTGFYDLDKQTAGLQPGDLVIVAGRPSMGKTAFSMNIGEHVAVAQQLPVAVFSMEMSATQLAGRVLGSVGHLDQSRLRTGRLDNDDWARLQDALSNLKDVQLHIDDSPALTCSELRSRARRLARKCGQLGLIIVDYIQLMMPTAAGETRATELSEISRGLKALAKELGCPVIALSQLNRSVEQRPNKRPVMSDLRESGAIEQDADLILFIYRDEVYNPDSPNKGLAEIIIGKQRNGPIGTVTLTFLGNYTKFENFAANQDGYN